MINILLTGSSGFIGSNLLQEISKFHKIYITVRKKPTKKFFYKKNIIFIYFKNYEHLNNQLKKIRIHTVIHCATHYVKNHVYSDIHKLAYSNILLGNIILENLKIMKVKRFVNFSTIWQDTVNTGGKYINLYAAYKKGFSEIVNYYKNLHKNINFFEILISDTFGVNDKREKLAFVLKKNYKNNKFSKIISKNLFMNLLNVKDINSAIIKILNGKIKADRYVLKNNKDFKISYLIEKFNEKFNKKLKVKWQSNKIIKYKVTKYNNLRSWKPKESAVSDIINYIAN